MAAIEDIILKKRNNLNSLLSMRKGTAVVYVACPSCGKETAEPELVAANRICPACGFYMPMPPIERLELIGDSKSFREMHAGFRTKNPLNFPGYEKKLDGNRRKTGTEDAFVAGTMRIKDVKIAVGVLDSRFLMGSMGTVVGEKIALLAEYAGKKKLPLIIFSASGGARMQEGLFSLMQMAKTAAAIEKFKKNGGLFISCLTNPTTGGVSASFANLGDIILAEPDSLICFAGPRVIEQTIGEKLPAGVQHAEFLLEHGMLDMVVKRSEMQDVLYRLLVMHR